MHLRTCIPLIFRPWWCIIFLGAAEALRSAAVRSVVHWDDQQPAPALIAAFVGKAFFAALRNSTVSAPEVRNRHSKNLPHKTAMSLPGFV